MKSCVFIVIDSGFSRQVLSRTRKILAAWDLTSQEKFLPGSSEFLDPAQIERFAGDPMGHGSIVLERFLEADKDASFILVKAFDSGKVLQTGWHEGQIARAGWSEAYVWAAELAASRGLLSIGNCSFGSHSHASDGSGWEAFQVGKVTGKGKAGHILVAAAGPGDGRPVHARLKLLAQESKTFKARQKSGSRYNLWFGLNQDSFDCNWALEARLNGYPVYQIGSAQIQPNLWNNRQQLKFTVQQEGELEIEIKRLDSRQQILNVDAWCETACFANWVCPELVAEPACFSQTLAVGLKASSYHPRQEESGYKPDILLSGSGQISFRLPELCIYLAKILSRNPEYDLVELKSRLPKFPF